MSIRKIMLGAVLVGTMALGVGAAGAQDAAPPDRPVAGAARALIQIVADETGLEPREIVAQLQEGDSLADIITTNGGDVDAVIQEATNQATERINEAAANGTISQERADQMLANLEDVVTRAVNGDLLPDNRPGPIARMRTAQILVQAAADETGLAPRDIIRQVRDGSTLADIITASGGSVENVVASAVTEATDRINQAVENGNLTREQGDEMIASLETVFTDAVNGEHPVPTPVQRALARGLVRQVADAAGLQPNEVVQQLQDGASLAEILTEHGVDVDTFTQDVISQATERLDQAVANGRITQEREDELIARLTERLPEVLNQHRTAEGNV